MLAVIVLYFCMVVLLVWSGREIFRWFATLRLPAGLGVCTGVASLVLAANLIPGVLGFLTPLSVTLVFCVLAIALIVRLRKSARGLVFSPASGEKPGPPSHAGAPFWPAWIFGGLGLLLASPMLDPLRRVPRELLARTAPLNSDLLWANLHSVIDFFQNGSLWRVDGNCYQSLFYGYELIALFPSVLFRDHWGIYVAEVFSYAFLALAVWEVGRCLCDALPADLRHRFPVAAFSLLALGLLVAFVPYYFGPAIGKNDVFVAACALAGLVFLFRWSHVEEFPESSAAARVALLGASLAVGLALSAKISVIAYLPAFVLCLALAVRRRTTGNALGAFARAALLCSVTVAALGAFFPLRNLVMKGWFMDPGFEHLATLSVWANRSNPLLVSLNRETLTVGIAACAPFALLASLWLTRRSRASGMQVALPLWLAIVHVVACAAFVITPSVVSARGEGRVLLYRHFHMPLFAIAAIAYALLVVTAAVRAAAVAGPVSRRFVLPAAAACFVVLAGEQEWRRARVDPGLVAVDPPKFVEDETDGVFAWAESLPAPARIYAVSVYPYPLVGSRWQHEVFVDKELRKVAYDERATERVAAVLHAFRPEYIVLYGNDPDPDARHLSSWLDRQGSFERVFADEAHGGSVAYRVSAGWERDLPPPAASVGRAPRMVDWAEVGDVGRK